MSATTLTQTVEQLRDALAAYIEATYHIRDPYLLRQRRALLEQPGIIQQVPFVEVLSQYERDGDLLAMVPEGARQALAALSTPAEDDLGTPLPTRVFPPYVHQANAIQYAVGTHPLRPGSRRSLVVTTGTGSGKTETFLIPLVCLLSQQAYEGRAGQGKRAIERWKAPAVRALVLYPMNALVNDQLGRMRSWLGDPRLVRLLVDTWGGPRPLRFARYTSRSPYPGLRRRVRIGPDGNPIRTKAGRLSFSTRDTGRLTPTIRGASPEAIKTLQTFYCELEREAEAAHADSRTGASLDPARARRLELVRALRRLGKWPAKPRLRDWLLGPGRAGGRWFTQGKDPNGGDDVPRRAACLPRDSELYTRHEVQQAPPDVLITNYSMLEYMLMRPLERGIFDATRAWLREHPEEHFLLVVDEAHLYRGTAGAEVAMLLRRLCERLELSPSRLQVILTSASFSSPAHAQEFAAQLTGKQAGDFEVVAGVVQRADAGAPVSIPDLVSLALLDRAAFEDLRSPAGRAVAVRALVEHLLPFADPPWAEEWTRCLEGTGDLERLLFHLLSGFGPLARLRAVAMPGQQAVEADGLRDAGARPIRRVPENHHYTGRPLTDLVFGHLDEAATREVLDRVEIGRPLEEFREAALTALLSVASAARSGDEVLLPSRAHVFFRGLPGLWVCVDSQCGALPEDLRGGVAGKLFAHDPGPRCECGARVFPLYTCRDCGSAFARTYTRAKESDLRERGVGAVFAASGYLWSEPGTIVRIATEDPEESEDPRRPLEPLDLLLVSDAEGIRRGWDRAQPCVLHLRSGRLEECLLVPGDAEPPGTRLVFAQSTAAADSSDEEEDDAGSVRARPGQFYPCPCCGGSGASGSTVMDHVTKGQAPFAALVGEQLRVQRAKKVPLEDAAAKERRMRFAPLEGRKVLVFSDSRQKAAGLSIDLNSFAARDAVRPLLALGWRELAANWDHDEDEPLHLGHAKAALLMGEALLSAQLRAPVDAAEADQARLLDEHRARWDELVAPLRNGGTIKSSRLMREAARATDATFPGSWSAVLYGALVGAGLKIESSGAVRPRRARPGGLNRATTLGSLAVGRLVAREDYRVRARAGIPAHSCPHSSVACDDCRDRIVNLWLLLSTGYGVEVGGLVRQAWRVAEAVRPLPARLGGTLQRMLRNAFATDLDFAALHRGLRSLFTADDILQGTAIGIELSRPEDPGDEWAMCETCSTVQPRVPAVQDRCVQCGEATCRQLMLNLNSAGELAHRDQPRESWFASRKQLFRGPIVRALLRKERPFVPVAAEHTAQVGDAPAGEVFSPAELHELLFQDIQIGRDHRGRLRPAVDVLSSTTTMEVGIDIGSLSGVALRNMPPRRDNYQQRAGRAGRRGDGVATVVAYANTGTHDTHAYERPEVLLADQVENPRLALDNVRVAHRHATASLLQRYAHEQLQGRPPWLEPQLFEVLGTLRSFLDSRSRVSLDGFRAWLGARPKEEASRIATWAAAGLSPAERPAFEANVLSRAWESVHAATIEAERRYASGHLSGTQLGERALERTGCRVRPLIEYFSHPDNKEWIEFVPQPPEGAAVAPEHGALAKAILSLHNTYGGMVVVGLATTPGAVAGIPVADAESWWGTLAPRVLGRAWVERAGGVEGLLTPVAALPPDSVRPRLGWLGGQPVGVLLVERAVSSEDSVRTQRAGHGPPSTLVRLLGQGVVELQDPRALEDRARRWEVLPARLGERLRGFERWWEGAEERFVGEPCGPSLIAAEDEVEAQDEEPELLGGAASVAAHDRDLREDAAMPREDSADREGDGAENYAAEGGRRKPEDPDLLRLLIDEGVLPSYAFPTAVVAFHIVDPESPNKERLRFHYVASQGLDQALSQYAPGRTVFLDNQTWHVGALFDTSPNQRDRRDAYQDREPYFHCGQCNFLSREVDQGVPLTLDDMKWGKEGPRTRTCPLCGNPEPLRAWLRPTGFLHTEVEQQEGVLEPLAYATSARLVLPRPTSDVSVCRAQALDGRVEVVSRWRAPLLVLNEGAERGGYAYCTSCGRIEPDRKTATASWRNRNQAHAYPYPRREDAECHGKYVTRRGLTLGHQFETDVCLLQLDLAAAGVVLSPAEPEAQAALQSLAEAFTIAAAERVLRLQEGELEASYRWPVGPEGKSGQSADLYVYDRVPGGAGYSDEVARQLPNVFHRMRELLEGCPDKCARSCYKCLRRYRNQLHHAALDRHLALYVLDALENGQPPAEWGPRSHVDLVEMVAEDVVRQVAARGLPASVEEAAPRAMASVGASISASRVLFALKRPFTARDELASCRLQAEREELDIDGVLVLPIRSFEALHNLPETAGWAVSQLALR